MHFDITVLSIMCDKCSSNDEKIFKEKESIEMLKVHGLRYEEVPNEYIVTLKKKYG